MTRVITHKEASQMSQNKQQMHSIAWQRPLEPEEQLGLVILQPYQGVT
jgi:hypothetical protein